MSSHHADRRTANNEASSSHKHRGRSQSPRREGRRADKVERGGQRTSRSRSRSPTRRHRRSRTPRPHSRSHSISPQRRQARSSSRSQDRHKKRRRSRSASESSNGSVNDEDRRRKRRKDKYRRSRSRSRDKRERKRDKKEKKDKKKKKKCALTGQWGLHGIIGESDLYNKEAEFRTWLVEERKINPEIISKDLTKKEFSRFMEDYNTATLPHEKYYDMGKFERRMSMMRNGETLPPPDDGYDPNADIAAHTSAHKRAAAPQESYLSKEQLQELRRVQNERIQVGKMKLLGMDIKQSVGVRMDGSMFDV